MNERPRPDGTHDGWRHRTTRRDDVSLAYYRRRAVGPPIVAVHGITAWAPDLFDVTTAIGAFDVVVQDVRGHGRSDAPEAGYDLETAVRDLRAIIDDADVEAPILLGHSLGGSIVTAYAARYSARAVIALDPVGLLADEGDEPDAHEWVPALIREGRRSLSDSDTEAEPGAAFASIRVRGFIDSAHADPTDRYAAIDCPTLILRADVPAAERRADEVLVDALPHGRVIYVDGAGHTVHRDRPTRTAGYIRSFLSDVGVSTAE